VSYEDYLESLGDQLKENGWFIGLGRRANYARLPDSTYGRMNFQHYLIELKGDAETLNQVRPRFELKIMRPGG